MEGTHETRQTGKRRGKHKDLNTHKEREANEPGKTSQCGADNQNWMEKSKALSKTDIRGEKYRRKTGNDKHKRD